MKKLLEQLYFFLLRKNLERYRKNVTRLLKFTSAFPVMEKLRENVLYFHEAQSALCLPSPTLLKITGKFGTCKTFFAWGMLSFGGGLIIPLGKCQVLFADSRLFLIEPVDAGAVFAVAVDNSKDKVVLSFDGKDIIARKIVDAAGNEQYRFDPDRKSSWDKICLYAR